MAAKATRNRRPRDSGSDACLTKRVTPDIDWFHPPTGGEVYVVRTSAGLVLMDTGLCRFRKAVVRAMRRHGLDPRDIRLGFVSHFHNDHIAALGWFQKQFRFPVVAHRMAVKALEEGDRVVTGSVIPYAGFRERFMPCTVDYRVKGGEVFRVGDHDFEVVAAPGHTVGSIHVRCGRSLFVGDTLFGNGGIGWMDVHWGSNPGDYVETLRRMRRDLGALVLPGHGAPYRLTERRIGHAIRIVSFYVPLAHGLGSPRAPSQYSGRRG
jgi:glyoxylase-like metal-dependent hydrolase (beta-lactamase superfamily II)